MKTLLRTVATVADEDHRAGGAFPYMLNSELINPIVEIVNPGLFQTVSLRGKKG